MGPHGLARQGAIARRVRRAKPVGSDERKLRRAKIWTGGEPVPIHLVRPRFPQAPLWRTDGMSM
jgi:hypothetical protein